MSGDPVPSRSRRKRQSTPDQLARIIELLETIAANVQMLEYREAAKEGERKLPRSKKRKPIGYGGVID